jgi:hypothetical protein
MTLENLQPTAAVRGILPDQVVTVVSAQWFGSEALELTYKAPCGRVANELPYRHDEPRLEILEHGRSVDGDGRFVPRKDGTLFSILRLGGRRLNNPACAGLAIVTGLTALPFTRNTCAP